MSGGAAGIRRQIAELRMLVAQAAAARTAETINQDADSVAWAERVSGLVLDPWQRDVLLSNDARLALLACRQSGKSTIVALMASNIVRQGGMAITVSPSLRQSSLLFRKLHHLLVTGGESFRRETQTELETLGGGVALCLPGDRPDMLRGLSLRWPTTSLLIVDEAARVRESMWSVISPMLAAAPTARQALLSTPAGASGEFHRVMASGEAGWRRIIIRAEDCSRIAPAFLARERIRLGDALFRQEYHCEFIASPGSVFSAEILSAMFAEAEGQECDDNAPPQAANGASRFVF